MKVLVTGAAGFIGYHTILRLINDGHEVVGLDNLGGITSQPIKYARLEQLGIPSGKIADSIPVRSALGSFSFIKADILDRQGMIHLCATGQFDVVVHLAALAGIKASMGNPLGFFDTNTLGTENMLEAARLAGIRHFFFSSSSVVHGAHAQAPLKEDDDVDEPMNIYASSKRAAELLCYSYARAFRLPVTIFRFFTAYGSWCRPDSKPMTIARDIMEGNPITVLNDGYLVRDFTYVDDIIDGMMSALASPCFSSAGAPCAIYNVGRAKPIPFLSFVQTIGMALGKSATIAKDPADPLTRGERVEMYADTTKIEAELAYSPVWDYEEAVPMFAQWFKDNYKVTFNL